MSLMRLIRARFLRNQLPLGKSISLLIFWLMLGLSQEGYAISFTFTTFDAPSANYTAASRINNAGQIVGSYGDGNGNHAFLKDGVTFTAFNAPSATHTYFTGINDSGQMVGFSTVITTSPSFSISNQGFMTDGTTFTPIDVPPGATFRPFDINNGGQMVGLLDDPYSTSVLKDGATFTPINQWC